MGGRQEGGGEGEGKHPTLQKLKKFIFKQGNDPFSVSEKLGHRFKILGGVGWCRVV